MTDSGLIAKRLEDAIVDFEYEAGDEVRIYQAEKENVFFIEYDDGSEFKVTVERVKK